MQLRVVVALAEHPPGRLAHEGEAAARPAPRSRARRSARRRRGALAQRVVVERLQPSACASSQRHERARGVRVAARARQPARPRRATAQRQPRRAMAARARRARRRAGRARGRAGASRSRIAAQTSKWRRNSRRSAAPALHRERHRRCSKRTWTRWPNGRTAAAAARSRRRSGTRARACGALRIARVGGDAAAAGRHQRLARRLVGPAGTCRTMRPSSTRPIVAGQPQLHRPRRRGDPRRLGLLERRRAPPAARGRARSRASRPA